MGGGGKRKAAPMLGSGRATGSGIDRVENLCLVGPISTLDQICHICQAFSSGEERAEQQDANRLAGRERRGRGRMERARKTEGGKIEMPLPHIGNINPSFREYKKKEKKG